MVQFEWPRYINPSASFTFRRFTLSYFQPLLLPFSLSLSCLLCWVIRNGLLGGGRKMETFWDQISLTGSEWHKYRNTIRFWKIPCFQFSALAPSCKTTAKPEKPEKQLVPGVLNFLEFGKTATIKKRPQAIGVSQSVNLGTWGKPFRGIQYSSRETCSSRRHDCAVKEDGRWN